jgi:ribonucleoside-diphosphate reductase alpha chain
LGSINVSNFVDVEGRILKDRPFNKDKLEKVIHTAIDFLNRMIDKNKYPLKKIETICKKNRKVGLGIMGWADALIKLGINYNSPHALSVAKDLMSFINTEATNYGVLRNYQNQTVTAIAPTGTLSIIAGCSSGIEPNFAYVMKRRQADQEMNEIHPLFQKLVEEMQTSATKDEIYDYTFKNGVDTKYLLSNEAELFVTANQVPWEQHVKMQAAFQEFTNLGVSKTTNLLNSATEDDVAKAFMLANDLHCKGTTVYRDGSRKGQVLSTGATEIPKNLNERPHVLSGDTYKVRTTEGKLYITVNKHNDKPVEVFSVPSTATGEILVLTEALCRLSSLALRHNVSPELIVKQLTSVRNQSLLSVPVNIANCLSQYVVNADKPKCPECKADATVTEGCMKCTKCGWSKCG